MPGIDPLFEIPLDITFSGAKGDKGDSIKGDKGEPGKDGRDGSDGNDGADGLSIKGTPGKDGIDGIDGNDGADGIGKKGSKGDKGDKGGDGLSAYEVWNQESEGTEGDFLESLKGKDAESPHFIGNAYTELAEQEDTTILDPTSGDLLAFNGIKWVNIGVGTGKQHLVPNPTAAAGVSWQAIGFSYLTDELGSVLTDEAGVALEGKDAAEMDYSISPFTQNSILYVGVGGGIKEDNTNFIWDESTFTVGGAITATGDITGANLSGTNTGDQTTTGTADRITVTDGADNPVIDISTSYAGQATITTLGTVTTGTWTATTIAVSYGGTGLTSYAVGDIIYASGTTTLAKLADIATGSALITGGVGVAPSYGKIGLTTHVSGVLPEANGGTGHSTRDYTNSFMFMGG